MEQLKGIVSEQNALLCRLLGKVVPDKEESKSRVVKPRDIPMLSLELFFEMVELCSSQDVIRVQVTKSRVSQELANLIHNQQIHGRCQTWKEVCTLLEREVSTEVNFDRAWKEIDDVRYEWVESPQAFVHSFICRYAVLENRFHGEILPDRDRMIKRKLCKGYPLKPKLV